MLKTLKFVVLSLITTLLYSQDGNLNMEILANIKEAGRGSGIWHFIDKNGLEYAALGTQNALIIYSLEDPKKPIERKRVDGVSTIWREVYSYKNHIYGVTDNASDGLIIIDMTNAPTTITSKFWRTTITTPNGQSGELNTCHTVFVDEKGVLCLNGCRPWQGVLFFDISKTPNDPKFIGAETKRYSHDCFLRNDTLWSSDINEGLLSVWDVRDKMVPVELATQQTPFNFNHNSWLSDDSKYVFTTDEVANAFVASYDVSNLQNIKLLDTWRPKDTEGTGVIPHNTRYLNGYLITSYYTDGIKIVDAHKPDNLIEVGSVDTYFGTQTGFQGCWGLSPFLPSGTIVASDIDGGLFIIKPTYQRASYFEGLVVDSFSKFPIENVSIKIKSPRKNEEFTDAKGEFKTGYAEPGSFQVEFFHPNYLPKIIDIYLIKGVVVTQTVELVPKATVIANVIVKDAVTLTEIEGAEVIIYNINRKILSTTGPDGKSALRVSQDTLSYEIVAGKWGYRHKGISFNSQSPVAEVILYLDKGYQDDFILNFNWVVQSTTTAGIWDRAEPLGTIRQNEVVQTDFDVSNDYGDECYVTGNKSSDPTADDIDNGYTVLTSPVMDLSKYNDPVLSYFRWFANSGGNGSPNDKMIFRITDGSQNYLVEEVRTNANSWIQTKDIHLKSLFSPNTTVKFIVDIGDDPQGHIVEGALDAFLLIDANPVNTNEKLASYYASVIPNHFNHSTRLIIKNQYPAEKITVTISNIFGQEIQTLNITEGTTEIGELWAKGIYLISLKNSSNQQNVLKVFKL